MNLRNLYILFSVLGAALPLSTFIPWLLENGINLNLFFAELFSTRIGGFFGLDVFVSALVLFVFIYVEGKRLGIGRLWIPILCTCCIGVSFGFPVFLYLRQVRIEST